MGLDKLKIITIFLLLTMLVGCDPKKEHNCVSVHYIELNGGTYSVIATEGRYGARTYQLFGKYVRNSDKTISITNGGNIRSRSGMMWHTTKIDPDMPQYSIYLHHNCRLCGKW